MFKGKSVGFRKETLSPNGFFSRLKNSPKSQSFTQHVRPVQSQLPNGWGEENEEKRRKCKLVTWGVCTESKICDSILNQYRAKISYSRSL